MRRLLLLVTLMPAPALAAETQAEAVPIEEVVVTAKRAPRSIMDVPFSVSSLSALELCVVCSLLVCALMVTSPPPARNYWVR